MTQSAIKKVEVLRKATVRYSPRVERSLSKAGKSVDSAVVKSAAKYYVALKKLAEE
ncbi:MAG: hypothetical protein ACE14L_07415 [Terriglobales bacterium]